MMRSISIALLLSQFFIFPSCEKQGPSRNDFQTFKVLQTDLIKTVEANGSIAMVNKVEVMAPVNGRMDRLLVKEGQHVRKGQKLAVMSSSTRTTLMDMAADKGDDERKYWKEQIRPTTIFSPVTGQILVIHIEAGENIRRSVMSLSTGMFVRADVDETDLPKIYIGQSVKVSFDISSSEHIMGKVTDIAHNSRTVNNVNVYRVELDWPEEEIKKLSFQARYGMTVTLLFETGRKNKAKAISINAVDGRSNSSIEVYGTDSKPFQLKLGDIYGELVEILSDVKVGKVVLVPAFSNSSTEIGETPFIFKKE